MNGWFKRSLKNAAFIALIFFSIVPLVIFGLATNYIEKNFLEKKLVDMANATMDKLSTSISKDFQGFIDLVYYQANSYKLGGLIESSLSANEDMESYFNEIKNEMNYNAITGHANYPYHFIIITKGDMIFSSYNYYAKSPDDPLFDVLESESWHIKLQRTLSREILVIPHKHYMLSQNSRQIYVMGNIVYNFENIATLLIGVDEYYFSKMFGNMKISEKANFFIIDQNGDRVVEGDDNNYKYDELKDIFKSSDFGDMVTPGTIQIDDKDNMLICKDLYFRGTNAEWKIVMIVPHDDLYKELRYINNITILLIMSSVMAVFFLIVFMGREIINPIINLNNLMKEVRMGNLDVAASEKQIGEIGQLGYGFNNMISNIKNYIENIKEEEEIKRKLEIKNLQSQIKPHFVRNTLDTIRWMAEIKKAHGISHAITSFIKLMDYNYSNTEMLATVREEIQYLDGYIYLQRLRYQNKFDIFYSIDEEIMECKILKLTFQPIVENSIIHGLSGKLQQGRLEITGKKEEDKLVFSIDDDGIGMDDDVLAKVSDNLANSYKVEEKEKSIALENVQKRIKMNFGTEYGITIKSKKHEGTQVRITFPIIY